RSTNAGWNCAGSVMCRYVVTRRASVAGSAIAYPSRSNLGYNQPLLFRMSLSYNTFAVLLSNPPGSHSEAKFPKADHGLFAQRRTIAGAEDGAGLRRQGGY